MKPLYLAALLSPLLSVSSAQPGSPSEPVRLVNSGIVNDAIKLSELIYFQGKCFYLF